MIRLDGTSGSEPAHRAEEPVSNLSPGENFSLKVNKRQSENHIFIKTARLQLVEKNNFIC